MPSALFEDDGEGSGGEATAENREFTFPTDSAHDLCGMHSVAAAATPDGSAGVARGQEGMHDDQPQAFGEAPVSFGG
jgi:hypothetical protein